MKLYSTHSVVLGLKAAGSGPQQAEEELSDEERVYSSGHDRFPKLQGVSSIRFHHTA
jgi:hypothetical protein